MQLQNSCKYIYYCQTKTCRNCLHYKSVCHTSHLFYLCVILQPFPTGLIQHQVNRPGINPTKSKKMAATIWENFTAIKLSLTTRAYTSETDQLWLMKLKSSQITFLKLYFSLHSCLNTTEIFYWYCYPYWMKKSLVSMPYVYRKMCKFSEVFHGRNLSYVDTHTPWFKVLSRVVINNFRPIVQVNNSG